MEIQFILERVHRRQFLSIRAFQIVFTEAQIYFVHLGEDSSQLPMGQAVGGLVGALAQTLADKQSEKSIAGRLQQMESEGLDAALARDKKRSFKAPYSQLEGFDSASYKWNRWPHVTFRFRGLGSFKFTFDLKMENLEEERQAIVDFMRQKRPDIVRAAPSSAS